MKLRRARPDDAAGIAKVHVDSWRTTYRGIIPDDFLNNLSYERRTELWKRNIADKGNYIVVAVNRTEQIIGFGTAGKREGTLEKNTGDLTSIYLLEEYQGKGVGKKLLEELFLYFKQMGYEKVFVEVLEDNKTRYFYEYYGAKLIKTVQINIGGEILNELIYEWNNIDDVTSENIIS